METKHTPGPWAYHNTPTPFIHVAAGGLPICQIYTSTAHGQSMGEQFANARLIAAAPDLLAFVLEMFAESEKGMAMLGIPMLSANWHNKAKTVIASTISNA